MPDGHRAVVMPDAPSSFVLEVDDTGPAVTQDRPPMPAVKPSAHEHWKPAVTATEGKHLFWGLEVVWQGSPVTHGDAASTGAAHPCAPKVGVHPGAQEHLTNPHCPRNPPLFHTHLLPAFKRELHGSSVVHLLTQTLLQLCLSPDSTNPSPHTHCLTPHGGSFAATGHTGRSAGNAALPSAAAAPGP
eukprot:CAMPEP_0175118990 /NCGR_PEP_ID=MMETSP0086_2-20121207/19910_1 /TAXON_ID=136419 /ORGANISM="Unknown Unknown, Strain D1" /LENGTH=186 /DNA_ID=CAMNT_0016400195 /DNA_START=143 /DNA_END=704 /DNA_ORIENTATION=+